MSARGGSKGRKKRGKKPNKKLEVARALERTIPKGKSKGRTTNDPKAQAIFKKILAEVPEKGLTTDEIVEKINTSGGAKVTKVREGVVQVVPPGGLVSVDPVFMCPKCQWVSHNPEDVANRFCGVCGFVEDDVECALCPVKIPAKDAKESFCHGCRKFICDKHENCELPIGGHDPEAHDEQPEDDEENAGLD